MPYINFQHGQTIKSVEIKAGDNIKVIPTANGNGLEISVTPDANWKTPSGATASQAGLIKLDGSPDKFLNGAGNWVIPPSATPVSSQSAGLCPQLPGNTNQVLRGDGTWGDAPGGGGSGVPSAPADANTTPYLYTPNGWEKYTIEQVPFLMVDKADLLAQKASSTLTLQKVGTPPSTKLLNGRSYYYNTFKSSLGGIYVLKDWFLGLGYDKLEVNVTRRGGNGMWAMRLKYNDANYMAEELVKECPNPFIHAKGTDGSYGWHHHGMTCGWGNTIASGTYGSYLEQLMNPNSQTYAMFSWGTAGADDNNGAVAVEHTLVFSKPMIKFLS